MSHLVLGFQEMDKTQLLLVGGKGLHLGALSEIKACKCRKDFA